MNTNSGQILCTFSLFFVALDVVNRFRGGTLRGVQRPRSRVGLLPSLLLLN